MYLPLRAYTCMCAHVMRIRTRMCISQSSYCYVAAHSLSHIYMRIHTHTHTYRNKVICNPIYGKDWIRKILSTIRSDSIRFVAVLPTLWPRPLLTLKLAVSDNYFGLYIRDYICSIIHNVSDFASAPILYDSWAERTEIFYISVDILPCHQTVIILNIVKILSEIISTFNKNISTDSYMALYKIIIQSYCYYRRGRESGYSVDCSEKVDSERTFVSRPDLYLQQNTTSINLSVRSWSWKWN